MVLLQPGINEALSFPWISVLHGTVQFVAVVLLCSIMIRTKFLPVSIDAQHDVYHDIESSTARILLPHKHDRFAVLADDRLIEEVDEEASQVPVCGGLTNSSTGLQQVAPTEMPVWMLKDDESGLSGMLRDMVCAWYPH